MRIEAPASGLVTVEEHRGDRNFAIWAHGGLFPELLVNEIGNHSGETLVPPGTDLLEIVASGQWSVTPE